MKSDIFVVKVEMKPGFDEQMRQIGQLQASRDEPRRLVSAIQPQGTDSLLLVFELA